MVNKRSKEYLIATATDVASRSAKEANSIGYMPRFMANMAFPTQRLATNEYYRRNGRYQFHLLSPSNIGLPYGSYPRQIIIYLATQAKLTQNREIHIGSSQANLLRLMGIKSSGGKTGTIQAFKEQTKRLFACSLLWQVNKDGSLSIESMRVTNKATLTWNPMQLSHWQASLVLEECFYDDIINHAVPIDLRVIKACCHYPLAMDIYCWLTYRYFRMATPQLVTWENLTQQFGNTYKRKSNFIRKFEMALKRMSLFYSNATYDITEKGLMLYPSGTHVSIYKK